MSPTVSMRDAFITRLYQLAKEDRDIILVSADMGAPSLDIFRRDLASQFMSVGIAEQNAVAVAAGLAMSGKKPFVFAIMPFVTLRPYELIRVSVCMMKLPVTLLAVGAGFSYEDSGPTHHSTDDLAAMRALAYMTIWNSSDSVMAAKFADIACQADGPAYVRLDREVLPDIYEKGNGFFDGLNVLKPGKDVCIVATGNMVHRALEVAQELAQKSIDAAVVDLYRVKPVNEGLLLKTIAPCKKVVTLEEHFLAGGMGSAVAEILADNDRNVPVKRFGVPEKYYYTYGGRNNIQTQCGLDKDSVINGIMKWLR